MKKLITICTTFIIISFSHVASAGLLLEPYMGMHLNSSFLNNNSNADGSISGMALGGRVGFQEMGFMFGVNGKRVTYDVEDSTRGELATSTVGLFAGYDFPILLRVWFEYIVSGTGSWDDDSVNNRKDIVGNGSTIGIGYKVFPFISLNLEIGNMKFNEYTTDTVDSATMDTDFKTYLLSISFPITL